MRERRREGDLEWRAKVDVRVAERERKLDAVRLGADALDGQRFGVEPQAVDAGALLPMRCMVLHAYLCAADAEGARIAGSPSGLMSALATLENANRRIPMKGTNSALHNLFIAEPFGGDTLSKLFATHPPTEKRLAALRKVAV